MDFQEKVETLQNNANSGLKDYMGEYKKIIWPDKKVLIKQTGSVIVVSLVIGAVICAFDAVFATGFSFFTSLL